MTSADEIEDAHFDGEALTEIPKDAIAYSVTLSGIRSTQIKYARLENEKRGLDFALNISTWSKDGLTSMNMPVASMWTASLAYSNATSFTPVLKIYYAYPVYSTKVR